MVFAALSLSGSRVPALLLQASTDSGLPPAFWGIVIFLIIATILSLITRRRK